MNAVLAVLSMLGAHTNEYQVDVPMRSLIPSMDPAEGLLNEALPAVQESLPACQVYAYAVPTGKRRYYKLELHVLESVGHRRVKGVVYRVEMWPRGGVTLVRSFIDLDVVARCRIIQRIVDAAEVAILNRTERFLRAIR